MTQESAIINILMSGEPLINSHNNNSCSQFVTNKIDVDKQISENIGFSYFSNNIHPFKASNKLNRKYGYEV